jgi:hypothetical protein
VQSKAEVVSGLAEGNAEKCSTSPGEGLTFLRVDSVPVNVNLEDAERGAATESPAVSHHVVAAGGECGQASQEE